MLKCRFYRRKRFITMNIPMAGGMDFAHERNHDEPDAPRVVRRRPVRERNAIEEGW